MALGPFRLRPGGGRPHKIRPRRRGRPSELGPGGGRPSKLGPGGGRPSGLGPGGVRFH